jgi:hypothetical protein
MALPYFWNMANSDLGIQGNGPGLEFGAAKFRATRVGLVRTYDAGMERVSESPMRGAIRQMWCNGDLWDERAPRVIVGETPDGRWYARICAGTRRWPDRGGACAYSGDNAEWLARGTALRWMRTLGGQWAEASEVPHPGL